MSPIKKEIYNKEIESPYNPEDVNIRLQHFRVADLVDMIKNQRIDIWSEDDLQRMPNLWSKEKKSLFIESLLIKLPIPLFYFDGSEKKWRVIDGLQRLHTIFEFIINNDSKPVTLRGLEYLVNECNNKSFDELPRYLQSRLLGAELEAYVINPGTPPEVKYNIFKRINSGGLGLNGQEIRNAFCRGIPADLTKKLAAEEIFIKATNGKITSRRMEDREYATRFIAFQIFGPENYQSKLDLFLTNALMALYNYDIEDRNNLKKLYIKSLNRCYELLGKNAFYRYNEDRSLKGRKPNKAVFDTLSWNMLQIRESQFNRLLSSKDDFFRKYQRFQLTNEKYYRAINDTTGSKTSVNNRFEELNIFIKDYIQ